MVLTIDFDAAFFTPGDLLELDFADVFAVFLLVADLVVRVLLVAALVVAFLFDFVLAAVTEAFFGAALVAIFVGAVFFAVAFLVAVFGEDAFFAAGRLVGAGFALLPAAFLLAALPTAAFLAAAGRLTCGFVGRFNTFDLLTTTSGGLNLQLLGAPHQRNAPACTRQRLQVKGFCVGS